MLLSSPSFAWREWLKENRGERDLICLDPSDPAQSPPGKVTLFRGSKPLHTRFFGGLDPNRAPHVLVAALAEMLPKASSDCVIQLFSARGAPLLRQVSVLCAQLAQPDEIFAPKGAALDLEGFPVGPEELEIEAAFPQMVQQAQRKAQWLKLIESCTDHEIDLKRVCVEGARLGSGKRLHPDSLAKAGLPDVVHGEVSSGTLFLITEEEPPEHVIARALDVFHATRAAVVAPEAYEHLLCSFARQTGEDFGYGIVRKIDFAAGIAHVACTAVPPAPVRILRLGGLRVDFTGAEHGEARPWQV